MQFDFVFLKTCSESVACPRVLASVSLAFFAVHLSKLYPDFFASITMVSGLIPRVEKLSGNVSISFGL